MSRSKIKRRIITIAGVCNIFSTFVTSIPRVEQRCVRMFHQLMLHHKMQQS
ncbi:hypothetical protein M3Y14_32970 (plasmid) [Bacillus thuringiensis]|nr:hypothetical protein [Bacillus thuringiensis]UYX55837.1 hypothetical protein M3Y14_32970 [Bacillus thuringiensis]